MTEERDSLFRRLRDSLFVRALVVYGGASWVVLEITSTFGGEFGLPTWFFPVAVGLLLIGLPIILGTAVVQSGKRQAPRQAPAGVPIGEFAVELEADADPAASARSTGPVPAALAPLLTWRRSILSGVLAFGVLGIVGALIVLRGTARVTEAHGAAGDEFEERAWIVVADFEGPGDEPDLPIAVREALTLDLQQSKYVNVASPSQIAGALRYMERADAEQIDVDLAREIAQREGMATALAGSVSRLGDSYVLGARVLAASSGEELVVVTSTASQDRLVEAVQALSREIRARLGESRAAVRASQPLPEVTTRSLEALRRYAQAIGALSEGEQERALDLAEAAIELDPDFAMAHRLVAVAHGNLGRITEASRATQRAYELRDKLSERERLHIEAVHSFSAFLDPIGTIEKYELILSAYPDDARAANNLASQAYEMGDAERGYTYGRRAVELDPYTFTGYANAIFSALRLGRFEAVDSLARLAESRGLDDQAVRFFKLHAVTQGDWARADFLCDSLLAATSPQGNYRADDEAECGAYDLGRGRVDRAVDRLSRAADLRSDRRQLFAYYHATTLLAQAELLRGRGDEGRRWLSTALTRHPPETMDGFDAIVAVFAAGYTYALLGDSAAAAQYVTILSADTSIFLLAAATMKLKAFADLKNGLYEDAIDMNRRAVERTFGNLENFDQLHRAQAFDGLGQRDSAIALYEDLVDPHSIAAGRIGEAYAQYITYLPIVHRRLGELYAEAGEPVKAAEHYEAFLELWSEADSELQPQVEAARRALRRLGAEQAAS